MSWKFKWQRFSCACGSSGEDGGEMRRSLGEGFEFIYRSTSRAVG